LDVSFAQNAAVGDGIVLGAENILHHWSVVVDPSSGLGVFGVLGELGGL